MTIKQAKEMFPVYSRVQNPMIGIHGHVIGHRTENGHVRIVVSWSHGGHTAVDPKSIKPMKGTS